MHVAGAVEEHVDRADLGGERGDGEGVGHVEALRADVGSPCQVGQRGLVDVGRDHPRALAREGFRGGAADALGRGGDESGLAGESLRHGESFEVESGVCAKCRRGYPPMPIWRGSHSTICGT